jgi:hypothetical protein
MRKFLALNSRKAITGKVNFNLKDKSMKEIIKYGENLEFLDISYCTELTDEGFEGILEKELKIKDLFINGLIGITNVSLNAIFKVLNKSLQTLEMCNLD